METLKINVVGQECPAPLNALKNALLIADPGQEIEITFSCGEATVRLPEYCEANDVEVLRFDRNRGSWTFAVRK